MRGFAPWPGAHTSFRGQTCHLWGEPFSLRSFTGGAPGTLLREENQILIACGHTTLLRLLSVKLEGRKQVSAMEFVNGARLTQRERFGNASIAPSGMLSHTFVLFPSISSISSG